MDKQAGNALKRARTSKGFTQEHLAEMSGYSTDSIQAWEAGTRMPSVQALDLLGICLEAPWLTGFYLREQASTGITDLIPAFTPGEAPSKAVLQVIRRIYAFADAHRDRRLMEIAEDDVISADERPDFDAIMGELNGIIEAGLALRYAKGTGEV